MRLNDELVSLMGIGACIRDNTANINAVDFSKCGRTLVSSSDDESMRIYNCESGEQTRLLYSKKYGVCHLRLTHLDGHALCASRNGWDETIRYLHLEDNRFLRYFRGHRDRVTALSLHPTSDTFLSSSADRTVRLWDVRSDLCQGLVRMGASGVVSHDSEGQCFAVGSGRTVSLYEMRSLDKGPFATFSMPSLTEQSVVSAVSFSYNGAFILVTSPTDGVLWLDAVTGAVIHHINQIDLLTEAKVAAPRAGTRHRGNAFVPRPGSGYAASLTLGGAATAEKQASFSPDGQYVACGSEDGLVYVWSVVQGRQIAALPRHPSAVNMVAWNPKYLMLASTCKTLCLWTPPTLSADV